MRAGLFIQCSLRFLSTRQTPSSGALGIRTEIALRLAP
jgi:hypothetical protein